MKKLINNARIVFWGCVCFCYLTGCQSDPVFKVSKVESVDPKFAAMNPAMVTPGWIKCLKNTTSNHSCEIEEINSGFAGKKQDKKWIKGEIKLDGEVYDAALLAMDGKPELPSEPFGDIFLLIDKNHNGHFDVQNLLYKAGNKIIIQIQWELNPQIGPYQAEIEYVLK